ncbi:MAG: hypothetical protein JO262_12045 [Solirubrobacterales bacterium]|nr:hypothetical protein [Solirubrobacterales bacterium]
MRSCTTRACDALVLIGGLGVHTGEYRPLIDALARHHRVLAAGLPAADIVGFSMGARIAIEFVPRPPGAGADLNAHRRPSGRSLAPAYEAAGQSRRRPELHLMPGGHLAALRAQAVAYTARIGAFTSKS